MLRSTLVLALLLSVGLASTATGVDSPSTSQKSPQQQLFQVPLSFEANSGQTDGRARYLARSRGLAVFLTSNEAVLKMVRGDSTQALRLQWMGSHPSHLAAEQPLPGKVNYLRGNDPAKWQTDVPTYGRVRYVGLYRGVDLVYYGNGQQLEYDLLIAPEGNPAQVRLRVEGAHHLRIASNGDLVIRLADGELRQPRPVIFQMVAGKRQRITGGYVLHAHNEVGFGLGRYDRNRELVIDPTLSYATFLGGKYTDVGSAVAPDVSGNAYVTGSTLSPDFPTKNRYEGDRANYDAYLTKLNPSGTGLVYSTYLGGSGLDQGTGVGIDRDGFAYVVGSTTSANFPVTIGAYQGVNRGGNTIFITKFNQSGTGLVYSTYMGGTGDQAAFAMTLDSQHRVYVTGMTNSSDFPLQNAYQSALRARPNGVVLRLNADGRSLSYSTYLGGSGAASGEGGDWGTGIVVDSTFHAYVTGVAESPDFPTTAGSFQSKFRDCGAIDEQPPHDAYVTKFSADGSALVYSTFFGGGTNGSGIAVDSQGRAYITGQVLDNDPARECGIITTSGAFQRSRRTGNSGAGFVVRFNASASGLSYSTYMQGSNFDWGTSIAVDGFDRAYATGWTESSDFPLKSAFQSTGSVWVAKLWATGGGLFWSTRYGGEQSDYANSLRLDGAGDPYIAGTVGSSTFKTTTGAFDRTRGGMTDAFVMKITN